MKLFNNSYLDNYKPPVVRILISKRKAPINLLKKINQDSIEDSFLIDVVNLSDLELNVNVKTELKKSKRLKKRKKRSKGKKKKYLLKSIQDEILCSQIDRFLGLNLDFHYQAPNLLTLGDEISDEFVPEEDSESPQSGFNLFNNSSVSPETISADSDNFVDYQTANIADYKLRQNEFSMILNGNFAGQKFNEEELESRSLVKENKKNAQDMEKIHKCTECDYASKRLNHLKRHMNVHNKMRFPFKCSKCAYASARRDRIRFHKFIKHTFK